MIGWVITEAQSAALKEQVAAAFAAREMPQYWEPGEIRIGSGPHASQVPGVINALIPMSDDDKATVMRGTTRLEDFPEFAVLAAQLGGLGARVDVDIADFWTPETE